MSDARRIVALTASGAMYSDDPAPPSSRGRLVSEVLERSRDPLLAYAGLIACDEARWEALLARIAQLDDDGSLAGLEHTVRAEQWRRRAYACMRAAL